MRGNTASYQSVINTIRKYFSTQPIERAWLFGSFARGEQTEDSDIDIIFEPQENQYFSLLTYAHIHRELEQLLHRKVDLVEEGTLRPLIATSAEKDKTLIYDRSRS